MPQYFIKRQEFHVNVCIQRVVPYFLLWMFLHPDAIDCFYYMPTGFNIFLSIPFRYLQLHNLQAIK